MSRPQVIDDEERERVHDRVAAVDVAKDSGVVCTRTPHPSRPGARRSTVWTVKARMNAIRTLGRQLKKDGIEVVTLESTSDTGVSGLRAGDVRAGGAAGQRGPGQEPARRPKTDKLDAQWLARLTEMGLLRASFVPPAAIRALRDYTRARTRLVQERTRCWQRLEKLLESALVKVSSVASKLTTESAKDMVKAMIAGQRDPHQLAALARGRMKAKHDNLVEALDGMFDDHHGELAQMLLDQVAFCDTRIGQLTVRITGSVEAMPEAWGVDGDGTTGPDAGTGPDAAVLPAVQRLAEIPGISPDLARSIIAETGLDIPGSPPPPTWCRGPGCAPQPASPAPAPATGRKARATATCVAASARPPSAPPAPAPSSANATGASPAAAARPRPRSPWPAPSWSPSAPARRPRRPVHRPRPRLLPGPHRQRQEDQKPHPADRSAARPPHHHHASGRLTHTAPDQARSPHQARVRCRAPISGG